MGWNYERSKERVQKEWTRIQEAGLNIQRLTREMDLRNLSPTDARLVHGVHLYADILNLSEILDESLMRRDDYKRVYRYLHVPRVEFRRIIQSAFGGDKIQVQGSKFHGLIFKPYDDDQELAWISVLSSLAFHLVLSRGLPEVFPEYPCVASALGLELGDTVVANIGIRGDRELISVGNAANHAAKLIGTDNTITIGENLYSSLSDEHKSLFTAVAGAFQLDCDDLEDAEEIIRDEGFDWSLDRSVAMMQDTLDSMPLDEISIEEARARIDLACLGPKHAKVCYGSSIFIDIDGYTKLVDSLREDLDELSKAVQLLHLFRYELREVTESDFDGIVIQHQGDRLQVLFHLPVGDDEAAKNKAVEASISYNSSVEEVLSKGPAAVRDLHVSIGCDFGKALVGWLGVRGDLDATCVGDATLAAESIQLIMKGGEIGIDAAVYEAIEEETVKDKFQYDKNHEIYTAKDLTWVALELAERATAYAGSSKAVYTGSGTIVIGKESVEQGRPLKITRPWFE
jgi:class 3 adenylate cyclase